MARKMVLLLLNEAMQRNRRITFTSFDRIFPNQDLMPNGGFGNLIALPIQYDAINNGKNSLFINEEGNVINKQFHYLKSISKITTTILGKMINNSSDVLKEIMKDDLDLSVGSDEVKIIESSILHIYKLNLKASVIQSIRKAATIWNNQYFLFQRMHRPIFTKNTPMTLSEYEETDTHINIPRGLKSILQKNFSDSIILKDETIEGTDIDVTFNGQLYSYQKKVVEKVLNKDMGIVIAPTGSGKTVIALNIIASIHKSTLIILNNRELLKQWKERISQFLEYPKTSKSKKDIYIGEFSGSKKRMNGNIDIALVKSLANIEETEVFDKYGLVIIDECHHAANATYRQVLKKIKAKKIYSITATLQRADGQDKIVNMYLGEVIAKVSNDDIEEYRNYQQILVPKFTTFSMLEDTDNFISILEELVNNQKRNLQIANDVIKEFKSNRNCIILSERIQHLDSLYEYLKEVDEHVYVISGETKNKDKIDIIDYLKNTTNTFILIASSKLLGEGFDMPSLETMFMATPFAWKGRTSQYSGRLHRSSEGKTVVKVYDYVDQNIEMLSNMYRKRLVVYKKEGYEIQLKDKKLGMENHLYDNSAYQKQVSIDMLNSDKEILICSDSLSLSIIKRKYTFLKEIVYAGVTLHVCIYEKAKYDIHCIRYLEGLGVNIQMIKIRSNYIIIDKKIMWLPRYGYLFKDGNTNTACRLKDNEDIDEIYLDIKNHIIKDNS
jgi:superfamily II DNA or RNA helicase